MPKENNILQELNELGSRLASLETATPYVVPNGYFEGFPERMLSIVTDMDMAGVTNEVDDLPALLKNISREMPYSLPAGYFDQLDASFVFADEDAGQELKSISGLLGGIEKKNPYNVPTGYFDSKPSIHEVKTEPQPAKVVKFSSGKWMRYAAAAMVVGFIAMSGLLYFNRGDKQINKDPQKWVAEHVKDVNPESINKFIESTDDAPAVASVTASEDVRALMKDVSDKDIQEFLNETRPSDNDNNDDLFLN